MKQQQPGGLGLERRERRKEGRVGEKQQPAGLGLGGNRREGRRERRRRKGGRGGWEGEAGKTAVARRLGLGGKSTCNMMLE